MARTDVAEFDVDQAQKQRAAMIAQAETRRDALTAELETIESFLSEQTGTKRRKSSGKRGPSGPRDPMGFDGRLLEALEDIGQAASAEQVAAQMVENGYPNRDSLQVGVAGQFGKSVAEGHITRVERGTYKINAAGIKALRAIEAAVKAKEKAANAS